MRIGIDMMGGDYAPLEAVKGVQLYLSSSSAASHIFLIGDQAAIESAVPGFPGNSERVTIVHASQVVDMHEHPTKALKEKTDSSLAKGFGLLATGKIDAFISAGNSGAMLVGSMYSIKPLPGILRPTISTVIPKENGGTGLLLDVGLNADCKPEQLLQFAILGSIYAENILGIQKPRVALLNIGEEEGKGNLLAQATYQLLKESNHLNFIGNVEGRDIFVDKADVIVCDGFTGNVILKLAESIYDITKAKKINHEYLDQFNFEIYGGTPVLGIAKPVIIGHGISHDIAFLNMIRLAEKMIETNITASIAQTFADSNAKTA
jgi:phosphate acyltransferase